MQDTVCEPEINHLPNLTSEVGAPGASPLGTWEPQLDLPSELHVGELSPPNEPAFQQCFHQITAGHRCHAPAMRGEYFCRHHYKRARNVIPPSSTYEMPLITDRESLRAAVLQIASRVAANSLDVRRAGILLYSLQIALTTFPPLPRPKSEASSPEPARPELPQPETAQPGQPSALDRLKARVAEARAQALADSEEAARTPKPADRPPDTGPIKIPHSCFVPPGWEPSQELNQSTQPAILPHPRLRCHPPP